MRWLAVATVAVAGCGPQPEPVSLTQVLERARVVDLTHTVDGDIPVFPGGERLATETLATIEDGGYFAKRFSMGEHVGTHVDAPAHFVGGQPTIEDVEPETLVGAAAVLDVREQVAEDPDYAVSAEDVRAWERVHGRLGEQHVVLVHTGWAERWRDEARYRNTDDADVMHFPGVSVEASELLRERGVRAIGLDTLSTDVGESKTFAQHKDFLKGGGYHIENLARLGQLPASGAIVVVGVLPLDGGSGAPARVLALVPPPEQTDP